MPTSSKTTKKAAATATPAAAAKSTTKSASTSKAQSKAPAAKTKAAAPKAAAKAPVKPAPAAKAKPAAKAPVKPAPAAKAKPAAKAPVKPAPAPKAKAPAKPKATPAPAAKAKAAAKAPVAPAPAAKAKPAAKPKAAPAPKPVSSAKIFGAKFLGQQRAVLAEERSRHLQSAERWTAEADSLMSEREPGDVQFDDESGEGDSLAVERDRDLALSAQARAQVDQIDAALARLDGDRYGICVACGQVIVRERLEAIPWAAECVTCKAGSIYS